jgi:hypothetical protein
LIVFSLLVVEGGVSLGNLWVKSVNLVWLRVSSGGVLDTGSGILGGWLSLSKGVGREWVLDEVEFISLHGDVFTEVFISVHAGGELDVFCWLLDEVEFVTLHGDILTEVFISVHTSGELDVFWLFLLEVEFVSLHGDVFTEVFVSVHSSGELDVLLVEVEFVSLHGDVFTEVLVSVHSGGELGKSVWLLVEVEFVSLHGDVLSEILVSVHSGGEFGLGHLLEVEFITFHGNILTEVFITVHSSGEELVVGWGAGDSINTEHGAGGLNLDETSSGWVSSNGEWWLVVVSWGISMGGGGTNKGRKDGIFHFY